MKALIPSGGEGSRLRPITHTNAKQLIPIANKPILFYGLEAIAQAGIRQVGIVVGQTAPEIEAAVGDGSAWGLEVTYISQSAPLGLAHVVLTARDFVKGEPFLMYLGDNVLLEGVTRFVDEFERNRPDAQIFLTRVREPEHFGVAELEGERVVRLVEKPKEFVSDLALVGVYLFDDSIMDAALTLEPSWRGEYEITEAIQWLIENGRSVRAEMLTGWWKDTGRPEDLLEANRMLLSNQQARVEGGVDADSTLTGAVVIEAGAKVIGSRIAGPAVVGQSTTIEGSDIGANTSISTGCSIVGSRIEDSIVMEGCRLEGVQGLSGSILGKRVEVRRGPAGGTHRLVVGDQSQLELS